MPRKNDPRYKDPDYHNKYYAANRAKIVARACAQVKKRWETDPEYRNHRRNKNYIRFYGITLDQYNEMLMSQNNSCAICKTPQVEGTKKRLCIDHCHDSKIVRGLLCYECNFALGKFKDDVNLLKAAIEYLEKQS